MAVCGIDTVETNLVDYVETNFANSSEAVRFGKRNQEVPSSLKSQLSAYVANFDVLRLLKAISTHPKWKLTHVVDTNSGQGILLVCSGQRSPSAMMNLTGFISTDSFNVSNAGTAAVDEFLASKHLWLEVQ